MGTWYVIEQISTASRCFRYEFERLNETAVIIRKEREIGTLTDIGLSTTNDYEGLIDVSEPFNMKIEWPLSM